MSDALASPTLAQLYLAQGHPGRARTTLDEVLALRGAVQERERWRVFAVAEVDLVTLRNTPQRILGPARGRKGGRSQCQQQAKTKRWENVTDHAGTY